MKGLHKDIRQIVKQAVKQGFVYVEPKGKGHPAVMDPHTGKTVRVPTSPSDWRSRKNMISALRALGFVYKGH